MNLPMERPCSKCATGICIYRTGIMCRAYVCMRDENNSSSEFFLSSVVSPKNHLCLDEGSGIAYEPLALEIKAKERK